jgi:hypothetical protein
MLVRAARSRRLDQHGDPTPDPAAQPGRDVPDDGTGHTGRHGLGGVAVGRSQLQGQIGVIIRRRPKPDADPGQLRGRGGRHGGPDIRILMQPRDWSTAGQRAEPGAFDDERRWAGNIDDDRLTLVDGRLPDAQRGHRNWPRGRLPPLHSLEPGEGGQGLTAIASDDGRDGHLTVLLARTSPLTRTSLLTRTSPLTRTSLLTRTRLTTRHSGGPCRGLVGQDSDHGHQQPRGCQHGQYVVLTAGACRERRECIRHRRISVTAIAGIPRIAAGQLGHWLTLPAASRRPAAVA